MKLVSAIATLLCPSTELIITARLAEATRTNIQIDFIIFEDLRLRAILNAAELSLNFKEQAPLR